jgi:dephospho-CoA kinase
MQVALTGGVASGKTTVSDHLSELGIPVIDTDRIAHQLTARDGLALPSLRQQFGDGVFLDNGELDRAALRQRVFNNPKERAQLEALLHPLIERSARAQINQAASAAPPYVLIVVPLLVESGAFADADQVVVVDVPEAVQVQRLIDRDGIKPELAHAMVAAQASRQARLARADHVLDNNGDRDQLIAQVERLHQQLCDAASFRNGSA